MINLMSALTAIAVYMRLCELGHTTAAIICGVMLGALAQRVFRIIKFSGMRIKQ